MFNKLLQYLFFRNIKIKEHCPECWTIISKEEISEMEKRGKFIDLF